MSAKVRANDPCGCGSGLKHKRCCQPWHLGRPAPSAEALMRSRYSAYQLGLVDYLLDTTDPAGPAFRADRASWRAEVQKFAHQTTFLALEVSETEERGDGGRVRFRVRLRQGERESWHGEDSLFRRVGGRWLYHGGDTRGEEVPSSFIPGR